MFQTTNALSYVASAISNASTARSGDRENRPKRVAVIGTFAPRKCGIATFTEDLVTKVSEHYPLIAFDVYALDRADTSLAYPPDVSLIAQDEPYAYRAAARAINRSGADAVWLQHEFGIFGGPDGMLIRDLIDRIEAPLIVTFHTILAEPSLQQRSVIRHLLARASDAMVMSQHGRDLLINTYGAAPERVTVIPHGAPDRPFGRARKFKADTAFADRPVLMTFGLLGPGKGLETAIEAMPAIVARHPKVLYRIVGATHPNLVRVEGERYRESLKVRAADLGLEDNIEWDDRFVGIEELLDQLEACDIYLTPYPNLQQSTSGTLSYAVALGKAVISTPYIHARELLSDDVGCLVPAGEPATIANAAIDLLDDPAKLEAQQRRAYERGRSTIWPEFARASAQLLALAVSRPRIEESRSMRRVAHPSVAAGRACGTVAAIPPNTRTPAGGQEALG